MISDYAAASDDTDATETDAPEAANEAASEAKEGETLQRADVYMQHPRGGNNGVSSKDT